MKRFLKKGKQFQGWSSTAKAVLEEVYSLLKSKCILKRGKEMKESKFIKRMIKIYKLSSDFQSKDEADREEDDKIEKKLRKELAKKEIVAFADKKVTLKTSDSDTSSDSD